MSMGGGFCGRAPAMAALVLLLWVSGCGGSGNAGSGVPAAPANLNAIAGDAEVSLAWSPVSGATSYKVYRDGANVATWAQSVYSDSPLNNNTTYTYQVTAVNASGEGASSPAIKVQPQAQLPIGPINVNAVPGDGQ